MRRLFYQTIYSICLPSASASKIFPLDNVSIDILIKCILSLPIFADFMNIYLYLLRSRAISIK